MSVRGGALPMFLLVYQRAVTLIEWLIVVVAAMMAGIGLRSARAADWRVGRDRETFPAPSSAPEATSSHRPMPRAARRGTHARVLTAA
jgi:hypothetical protein